MHRVSGVIDVGGKFVHVVADNINSGFIRVGGEIESGTVMVNFLIFYVLCFKSWPNVISKFHFQELI